MSKDKFIEDWLALSDIEKCDFLKACANACEAVKCAQIALFGAVREVNEASGKINTLNSIALQTIKENELEPKGDL